MLLAPALSARVWGSTRPGCAARSAWRFLPVVARRRGARGGLRGQVLPAAWLAAIGAVETRGARVGRLTSLNTLAGVAGSLAAGFVMIPALGVSRSVLLLAGLYAAVAALALWMADALAALALALGVVLGVPRAREPAHLADRSGLRAERLSRRLGRRERGRDDRDHRERAARALPGLE